MRYVSRGLSLFLALGLLPAAAAQEKLRPRVDFVYLGGSDCPYCRGWEAFDLPKLKASPLFQQVRFTHVVKVIRSPVPSSFWFPAEIKHLREPIAEKLKGAGSPMFAILADGKVVASWIGTRKSPEEILQIIEGQQRLLAPAMTPNPTVERDASARPSP
jgi:hypothetical protein